MPPFLTQERFPRLWLLFQVIFGGTRAKKRLALKCLGDHKNVIEVGCSMGLLAPAFSDVPGLQYLGIDIDPQAIEHAKARSSDRANVTFSTQTMRELGEQGQSFDYVLFANILHHVDDATAVALIRDAARLVGPGGEMVVIEPERAPATVGAVMTVAPFGRPVDGIAWDRYRARTGRPVVIDAAAGFDSLVPCETPSVVSLHATKVIGVGEGGFVASTDEALIKGIRARSNFGFSASRSAIAAATTTSATASLPG
jgi:SAM-dependent methyltransferase